MKYLIITLCLLLSGCASQTQYGRCIGLNGHEDPSLIYEYSGLNVAIGLITLEMIVPPVIVLLDELKCPVGKK